MQKWYLNNHNSIDGHQYGWELKDGEIEFYQTHIIHVVYKKKIINVKKAQIPVFTSRFPVTLWLKLR